jgi:hypothetical protein
MMMDMAMVVVLTIVVIRFMIGFAFFVSAVFAIVGIFSADRIFCIGRHLDVAVVFYGTLLRDQTTMQNEEQWSRNQTVTSLILLVDRRQPSMCTV